MKRVRPENRCEMLPDGKTVRMELTHGKSTIFDLEDLGRVKLYAWNAVFDNGHWYARRAVMKWTTLHRFILNNPTSPCVDHKNYNTLDNRKINLRPATKSQNAMNRPAPANNSTGYKGVSFYKARQRFEAYISKSGKRSRLGLYDTAQEAAQAYNEAAIVLHGEFARLNELKSAASIKCAMDITK